MAYNAGPIILELRQPQGGGGHDCARKVLTGVPLVLAADHIRLED